MRAPSEYLLQRTYVVAFLTDVSGFRLPTVTLLLLLFGIAGVGGTLGAGALADRHPRPAMIIPLVLATVALLGLYLFGTTQPAAVVLVGLTGLGLAAVPTAMQNRIMQVAPGSTEIASAANGAAFNLGIAGGALIGGVLLPLVGVRATPLAGALLTGAGLAVLLLSGRIKAAGTSATGVKAAGTSATGVKAAGTSATRGQGSRGRGSRG